MAFVTVPSESDIKQPLEPNNYEPLLREFEFPLTNILLGDTFVLLGHVGHRFLYFENTYTGLFAKIFDVDYRFPIPDASFDCIFDGAIPAEVDASDLEAITAHTEADIAGLQQFGSDHQIHSRHSEISVTLGLDQTEVRGDIDHLSVTENGYLIVDYKTSDLSSQSLHHLTEHYLPQLVAYAGALFQANEEATEFEIGLVFTDVGVCRSRILDRNDVEALLEWAQRVIEGP